jgi:hypothetical protein
VTSTAWLAKSASGHIWPHALGECTAEGVRHVGPMTTPKQLESWTVVRGQGLNREVPVVCEIWLTERHTAATAARFLDLATRFTSRLHASGVKSLLAATPANCEGFLWAFTKRRGAPSMATVHLRRTVLHGLFGTLRQLEPGFVDPSLTLELAPRASRVARPLTTDELTSVRTAAAGRARSGDRAALAVALAEATATSWEIPQVRWADVNLQRRQVQLPGTNSITARSGTLSPWGAQVVARVAQAAQPASDTFVVSRRTPYSDGHSAQAAMANLLTKLLVEAGLTNVGIRPTSIRLWGAAQILEAHGPIAAARALGIASVDATLGALGATEVAR